MTEDTRPESRIREEICTVGASLYNRGYTVGAAGNISARLDDGWLITPTDACLGRLDPAALSKVDAAGNWVSGAKPSKTLALHQGIYRANPEARGIVHTHSTHLVALTLAGVWRPDEVLPPITPYQVMKVGRIPLIAYRRRRSPSPPRWRRWLPRCVARCSSGWGRWSGSAPWRMPPTRSKNSRKLRACG